MYLGRLVLTPYGLVLEVLLDALIDTKRIECPFLGVVAAGVATLLSRSAASGAIVMFRIASIAEFVRFVLALLQVTGAASWPYGTGSLDGTGTVRLRPVSSRQTASFRPVTSPPAIVARESTAHSAHPDGIAVAFVAVADHQCHDPVLLL